jgi:ABC-type multidrug transport system fused ATPase/permease subunit
LVDKLLNSYHPIVLIFQGKSTTVGLIERFYDPVSGAVEYLGNNIKDLNIAWYRSQIGYVGQEPTLFNDSIANNIAFGMDGVSRQDIIEAAKQANAYDFIMTFEDNFDTQVGERGTQLSGIHCRLTYFILTCVNSNRKGFGP